MEQWIAPGKVDKISKKRELYTVAFVDLLEKPQSSCTIVGAGIAYGGRVGNMEGR